MTGYVDVLWDNVYDSEPYVVYWEKPFSHFQGWDFTELLYAWNMPVPVNDDYCLGQIRNIIDRCANGYYVGYKRYNTHFQRKAIRDMRTFVKKLSDPEVAGGYAPFWRGLSEVEDDWVFLQMFSNNLAYAWT